MVKDADGKPRGVTVDLATRWRKELGVAARVRWSRRTPASWIDALEAGAIDVSFMPVDDERKKRIDFGPVYFLVESTYMVTAASGIKTVAEVDRAGRPRRRHRQHHDDPRRRAHAEEHRRSRRRSRSSEAMEMMRERQGRRVRAVARFAAAVRGKLPGSRIVEGGFQFTGVAIAVREGQAGGAGRL